MFGGIMSSVAAVGNAASLLRACFAAGTPIRTPDGHKNIEDLRPGDLVLARHEAAPDGPVGPRVVEEVFSSVAPIFHLHVGGRVIRTTGEHPFYVANRGWIAANELAVGDLLLSYDGQILPVEDLLDTGEYEPVYNVRVAEYHTYFVGEAEWGWSVWAHNDCHHIVTTYSNRGRGWSTNWAAQSRAILRRARIGLGSAANKVSLNPHNGPHPELYHQRVFERLRDASRAKKAKRFECESRTHWMILRMTSWLIPLV
jgi:hypothetical protein